jgi:hypothetical protein
MLNIRDFDLHLGHIWFGKLPVEWCYQPSRFDEKYLSPTIVKTNTNRNYELGISNRADEACLVRAESALCIKLYIPSYNNSSGILGAKFTPDNSGKLGIRVGIVDEIPNENIVVSGLSKNLAKIVLEEAISILEANKSLGSGILQFDCAAFHVIDSNPFVFRLLTASIISCICSNKSETISSGDVDEIVKGALTSVVGRK